MLLSFFSRTPKLKLNVAYSFRDSFTLYALSKRNTMNSSFSSCHIYSRNEELRRTTKTSQCGDEYKTLRNATKDNLASSMVMLMPVNEILVELPTRVCSNIMHFDKKRTCADDRSSSASGFVLVTSSLISKFLRTIYATQHTRLCNIFVCHLALRFEEYYRNVRYIL